MPGIIDVFTVVFKGDTKQVDDSINKTNNNFKVMAAAAVAAFAAIGGSAAVAGAVFRAADLADNARDFSTALNVNIEDLTAWGDALAKEGGGIEQFQGTVSNLSVAFAQLQATGKSRLLPFFKELGISVLDAGGKARDVMDVLPELAAKFAKMGKQESFAFGRKLGIDAATIRLLQKGQDEVERTIRRQKELGVITQENADIADNYNDAIADQSVVFRTAALDIANTFLPPLTAVINFTNDAIIFFREHSDAVVGFFGAIAAVVTIAYLPAMVSAATATWLLVAPILAVAAPIVIAAAAFALIYEDVMNFIEGNDSLLGQLAEEFPATFAYLKEVIMFIGEPIKWLIGLMGDLLDALLSPIDAMDKLKAGAAGIASAVGGFISRGATNVGAEFRNDFMALKSELGGMGSNPFAAMSSQAISNTSNKSSSFVFGNTNINTPATDGAGIAKTFNDQLQAQISQANANSDDAVDY